MIRVTGPRVLVALPPAEHETVRPSGIILVHDPDRAKIPTRGIVVQLGDKSGTVDLDDVRARIATCFRVGATYRMKDDIDRALAKMKPAPFDVRVGDRVIFPAIAGEELELDGQAYVILHESDVIGVIEPQERRAA